MGEVYTYDATHLTIVDAEETVEFTQSADHGAIGHGTLTLDDTAGTQAITGQKDFSHTESSCSFPLTFRGFVGARDYGGEDVAPAVTTARKIQVSLEDLNSMTGHLLIHVQTGMTDAQGGIRPAETVAARGAWLMASPFVDFADNGRCDFPAAKGMSAADYRYRHAGDVLVDMLTASGGYNYHVNDWGAGPELTFRDDNASTADSSTLRISNVLSDASAVTLHPKKRPKLTRSPANVISKQAYNYAKGTVVEERTATATAFNGERSGTASNSDVKDAAKASDESTTQLWQLHTEEDVIEVGIDAVTSAQINLILPGMRLLAKFSHLTTEGYGADFTYFRVIERTVRPLVADGGLYDLDLKLSPQEEAAPAPAGIIQIAARSTGAGGGIATFPNPVTVGSLLVWMGCKNENGGAGPVAPNTDIAQPRWGAGAWTDATPALTRVEWDDPRAYKNGMKLYWKIADAVNNTSGIDEYTAGVCWEVSTPATMTGSTIVTKDIQTFASTYAIGSLGTPASGSVALVMLGLGAGAASPVSVLVALSPGVWVRDLHADSYQHVWESDNNSIGFNQPAPPETWLGHTTATGAALAATITDLYSHKWGGIAVLLG